MTKLLLTIFISLSFAQIIKANDCNYWFAKVDPDAQSVDQEIDENNEQIILKGIGCLLKQEGIKRKGVFYGSKPEVSQIVPKASVEIDALYYISELFYGNDNFASAVALVEKDKNFNSPKTVKKAFASYRKWFKKIKKIGLEEARKQKLDPLDGSDVGWY